MAQKSKKQHIAAASLPLFLENGFKGTSIDLVVKASGVSKPTVYNHFPDKAALILATLGNWIEINKPLIAPVHDKAAFDEFANREWLGGDTARIYALVIGEGFRFPEARRLFWSQFDQRWRQALTYLASQVEGLDAATAEARLDHLLMARLRHA